MYGGAKMAPLGLRYLLPFLPLACIMDTLKPRHGSVEHEENDDDDGENRHLNAPSHEWRCKRLTHVHKNYPRFNNDFNHIK